MDKDFIFGRGDEAFDRDFFSCSEPVADNSFERTFSKPTVLMTMATEKDEATGEIRLAHSSSPFIEDALRAMFVARLGLIQKRYDELSASNQPGSSEQLSDLVYSLKLFLEQSGIPWVK